MKRFTTYPNFQEFANAKKLFVNVVTWSQLSRVITFYEKCGQGHSWEEKPARFLDHLSYISIKAYLPVSQRYFPCKNLAGGDITLHIIPREVVYFLGIRSYSNINPCLTF